MEYTEEEDNGQDEFEDDFDDQVSAPTRVLRPYQPLTDD